MRARFIVEGADDMDDALAAIDQIVNDPDAVMPILFDALEPVATTAKGIVRVRTGRLRDGISVSDQADGEIGGDELTAYVGPEVQEEYAVDVEMGRPPAIGASGREYGATRAHPFMRPSWDQESGGILPAVADGLSKLLARELKD